MTNTEFETQGGTAFSDGAIRIVPRDVLVTHGVDAARAWYRGWDRANLAAPVLYRWLVIVPVLLGVEAASEAEAEAEAKRIIEAHHLLVHVDHGVHEISVLDAANDTPLDRLPYQCREAV